MLLSGHKTRAVVDRCNIVSRNSSRPDSDLAAYLADEKPENVRDRRLTLQMKPVIATTGR